MTLSEKVEFGRCFRLHAVPEACSSDSLSKKMIKPVKRIHDVRKKLDKLLSEHDEIPLPPQNTRVKSTMNAAA